MHAKLVFLNMYTQGPYIRVWPCKSWVKHTSRKDPLPRKHTRLKNCSLGWSPPPTRAHTCNPPLFSSTRFEIAVAPCTCLLPQKQHQRSTGTVYADPLVSIRCPIC